MRYRVFLTVLLTLLLSLSKESVPTETPNPSATTTQTTSESVPTETPNPSATTTQTTSESVPTETPNPSATTTQTTSESVPTETPNPSATTTQTTSESVPTETPNPSATTTQTTSGNFCNPDPCGQKLATCIALNSTFTCQCQYGFYYRNKDCHRGKLFPGVITLEGLYSNSVQILNSVQYEEVYQNVTKFFKDAFSSLMDFEQTVIVKIQPQEESRASLRMKVTVANLFMENTMVDNKTVNSVIKAAEEKSTYVSDYSSTTYCEVFNCDTQTTHCKENVFPKCICKNGFSKTEWDDRSCSDCSEDCSAEENEYCAKEKGVPVCKCLPNFEKKNAKCVSCSVGYSGENCKNNSELILIIVGTVFGAIILILVIVITIVSVRAKHKQDPEKKKLIKSGYANPNTSDDRQTTMFPRVQTTSGHANPGYQPNNPYEMRSSNGRRFPERDYDDMYEISREPEGFRVRY
ncbi:mucin-13 isoform X2 [Phalacrocorax aristotelis]|uniref:mucin-13 isoform X2 n=1 Tax=Phalacrocorax aristotelis TaxID=126867 RepID=UPI003F4C7A3F